jgi:hypothetical protein
MNNTCLLSTAYWAPIQYFTKFILHDNILIEKWETYPKQSYRNRMMIYGVNGVQSLQIPVVKGSSKNILLKDIKIAYDSNWQNNHIKSIESAYRSTPFYEYYIDDILPFYENKYEYLLDFNNAILKESLLMLDLDANFNTTSDFELTPQVLDLRNTIHPKTVNKIVDSNFKQIEYIQGFEQRHGFVPNLSILDLVFNCGPEAGSIIRKSTEKTA